MNLWKRIKLLWSLFMPKKCHELDTIKTVTFGSRNDIIGVRNIGRLYMERVIEKDSYYGSSDNRVHVERWTLFRKVGKAEAKEMGNFRVSKRIWKDSVFYTMDNARIDEYQGLGIGSMVYSYLINYYGALESDNGGTTSDQARALWESLGARRRKDGRYRVSATALKRKKKWAS